MNPSSKDIVDLMDASNSGLGLTKNSNLFWPRMPDASNTPHKCVSVSDTSGRSPDTGSDIFNTTIQITVRGNRNKYEEAHELAQDIQDFLHGLNNETVNGARYIGVWAEGDILPVGEDDKNRPVFTCNFRIQRT